MASHKDHFSINRAGERVVITLVDETLTPREEVEALFRHLNEILNMTPKPDLVISFKNVTHVASVFLGNLVKFHNQVQQRKGKLALADVNEQVLEIFKLTRIDDRLTIE